MKYKPPVFVEKLIFIILECHKYFIFLRLVDLDLDLVQRRIAIVQKHFVFLVIVQAFFTSCFLRHFE